MSDQSTKSIWSDPWTEVKNVTIGSDTGGLYIELEAIDCSSRSKVKKRLPIEVFYKLFSELVLIKPEVDRRL